jgi:hypothetical protein
LAGPDLGDGQREEFGDPEAGGTAKNNQEPVAQAAVGGQGEKMAVYSFSEKGLELIP